MIKNSIFSSIKTAGDGAFAQVNLADIRMTMDTNTFTSIESTALAAYGVFNAISLGSLVLNSITATTLKNPVSDLNPLGGGRFFYLS